MLRLLCFVAVKIITLIIKHRSRLFDAAISPKILTDALPVPAEITQRDAAIVTFNHLAFSFHSQSLN
jgi:hypothetical protein